MKKILATVLLLSSTTALAGPADAFNCTGPLECTVMTSATTALGTSASVIAPTELSSQVTDAALNNNIMMVKGDAVMALETGVVSAELQSVIDAVRVEITAKGHGNLTDVEILNLIAE